MTTLADVLDEELADMPEAASWRSAMVNQLRYSGGSVFAGDRRTTQDKAVVSRLAALWLAAEADGMKRQDIGDQLRQAAAGITFLERRATNEQQATEVIMLAVH